MICVPPTNTPASYSEWCLACFQGIRASVDPNNSWLESGRRFWSHNLSHMMIGKRTRAIQCEWHIGMVHNIYIILQLDKVILSLPFAILSGTRQMSRIHPRRSLDL